MMGPNHLEFLSTTLGVCEKELRSQTQMLADQARALRKRWWLLDKMSLIFLAAGAVCAVVAVDDWWQMTGAGVFFWLMVDLTKMRYEQIYGQVQREYQTYQLRRLAALAIVTALSDNEIELPKTFTSVDDLLADILKEEQ